MLFRSILTPPTTSIFGILLSMTGANISVSTTTISSTYNGTAPVCCVVSGNAVLMTYYANGTLAPSIIRARVLYDNSGTLTASSTISPVSDSASVYASSYAASSSTIAVFGGSAINIISVSANAPVITSQYIGATSTAYPNSNPVMQDLVKNSLSRWLVSNGSQLYGVTNYSSGTKWAPYFSPVVSTTNLGAQYAGLYVIATATSASVASGTNIVLSTNPVIDGADTTCIWTGAVLAQNSPTMTLKRYQFA